MILLKKNYLDMIFTSFVRITFNFVIFLLFAHLLLAVFKSHNGIPKRAAVVSDGWNFDHGSSFYFCFNRIWHPFWHSILNFWISQAFVRCNKETVWCFSWPYIITGHIRFYGYITKRKNREGMVCLSNLERHLEDRELLYINFLLKQTAKKRIVVRKRSEVGFVLQRKTVVTPKTLQCVHCLYL